MKKDDVAKVDKKIKKTKKGFWRWLRRLIYTLLLLVIFVIGSVIFIVMTETGTRIVNYGLEKSPVNKIVQIKNLTGTLWRGLSFDHLHIEINEQNYVDIENARVTWDFSEILDKKITIQSLVTSKADVFLQKKSESEPKKDQSTLPILPFSLNSISIPIDIKVDEVDAKDVLVALPDMLIFIDKASIEKASLDQENWQIKKINYIGTLHIGSDMALPLNATASIEVNKKTDDINIQLHNGTSDMRIGNEYFNHAIALSLTGNLNDLKLHSNTTFSWPNQLAKPVVITIDAEVENQADVTWDIKFKNVSNNLLTQGSWSLNKPMELTVNVDLYMSELKETYPDLSGKIKGDFSIQGDIKQPLLSGNIIGSDINGFGLNLDSVSLNAEHNKIQTTEFILKLQNLVFQDFTLNNAAINLHAEKLDQIDLTIVLNDFVDKTKVLIDEAVFKVEGTLEDHNINLTVASIFNTTDFQGVGHIKDRSDLTSWSLDINKLDMYSDIIGRYKLSKPASLSVTPDNISLSLLCIEELPTTLCMQGQKIGERNLGTVAIRRLQPSRLNAILPEEVKLNTSFDFVVSGQFTDPNNFIAVLDTSLAAGNINYQFQGYEVNVPLKKSSIIVRAEPKAAKAEVNFDWGNYLQIHGGGTLEEPFGKKELDLKVHGNMPTLRWLEPLIPVLQKLEGKLTFNLDTTGVLKEKGLDIGFVVNLIDGEIYNAEYNSDIKDIDLVVNLVKGQPVLNIKGGLQAGNGRMAVTGDLNLSTKSANLNLSGNSLLVADSENVHALVSPSLKVSIRDGKTVINGNLLIPELRFIYKSSADPRGSVQRTSPDLVVISSSSDETHKKTPSRLWANTTMDFNILLGEKISVGAIGFVSSLSGGMKLQKSIDSPIQGVGVINMKSGRYDVLGQELTLDKGRIQFSGINLTDPNIEFQASRTFDNKRTGSKVNVGVRVTGTVSNPKVSLFSQPAMETNSIVSYLALGTDVDSLTAIEVLQIAKMAQRIATNQIISSPEDNKMAKDFGLTDLGVMKDLSGNTSIGIGKYFTDNFYVGVGFSLLEDDENSSFGLMRYDFMNYFSFDTQVSSEYTTIDLRFSKEL